ncbi:hypothetical protein [Bartonella schoenbuchensis]|uniref:hypothetical protein n=1 Tax=Bartonella schoenbuchensis TaxID=165694 RepID=UPI0031451BDB
MGRKSCEGKDLWMGVGEALSAQCGVGLRSGKDIGGSGWKMRGECMGEGGYRAWGWRR